MIFILLFNAQYMNIYWKLYQILLYENTKHAQIWIDDTM